MNWFDSIARNMGTANAPFGFGLTPGIAPSQDDPALMSGRMMLGDIGMRMLASGSRNPAQAFGQAYIGAQDQARTTNKEQFAAQELMAKAEENRRQREEERKAEEERNKFLATLPPDVQMKARSVPGFLEDYIKATDPTFQTADAGGNWGMSVVPIKNKRTGELAAGQFNQGSGGIFINGEPADPNEWVYDPGALSAERAEGTMTGGAPKVVIEEYNKKIRPEMSAIADTVTTLQQAKTYLKKGIQTGSMSDKIQALRGLGAQLGFNVDERILSDTQAYQNFIGNVVIPRMQALGGNDSNEELARLYSLSGGDINQSLTALTETIDFIEQLQRRKFKTLKASEDVALRYIPGLSPIELGGIPGVGSAGSEPDLSTLSDAELEAIINGQ